MYFTMARLGLGGTSARLPGNVQWDASHHHMASWDDHPACLTCLNKMDIFCSETEPCDMCSRWGPEQWQKICRAEVRSAQRRQVRADGASW